MSRHFCFETLSLHRSITQSTKMSNIIFSLGLFLFTVDVVSSCCTDGWVRYGNSCYLFGHDDLTFHDAQRFCEHFKADLVNIETSTENTILRSHLSDLKDPKHWIGMTDELIENIWKQYPSETTATFLDWGPGQPDQGRSANCVAIWASYGYHWVDEPCMNKFKALCEKPAEVEVTHVIDAIG